MMMFKFAVSLCKLKVILCLTEEKSEASLTCSPLPRNQHKDAICAPLLLSTQQMRKKNNRTTNENKLLVFLTWKKTEHRQNIIELISAEEIQSAVVFANCVCITYLKHRVVNCYSLVVPGYVACQRLPFSHLQNTDPNGRISKNFQ